MTSRTSTTTLSEERFHQLLKEDRWISDIANPVRCCRADGSFKHFRTCSYPVEYIVSEDQITAAKKEQERRHSELLKGIEPGELVFVSMGSDAPADGPDSIGNHRIRCFFEDAKRTPYFIEFIRGKGNSYCVDSCYNLRLKMEYDKQYCETIEWNNAHRNRNEHRKFPSQFHYIHSFGKNEGMNIADSWTAITDFINRWFGCSYESARKVDYFLRAEEFVNTLV